MQESESAAQETQSRLAGPASPSCKSSPVRRVHPSSAATSAALTSTGRAAFHNRRSRIECTAKLAPRIREAASPEPRNRQSPSCIHLQQRSNRTASYSRIRNRQLQRRSTEMQQRQPAAAPPPLQIPPPKSQTDVPPKSVASIRRQISSPHTITAPCQIEVTSVAPAVRANASQFDANHATQPVQPAGDRRPSPQSASPEVHRSRPRLPRSGAAARIAFFSRSSSSREISPSPRQ